MSVHITFHSISIFHISTPFNPLSPGGTYIVHKKPIFFSIPRLQGLRMVLLCVMSDTPLHSTWLQQLKESAMMMFFSTMNWGNRIVWLNSAQQRMDCASWLRILNQEPLLWNCRNKVPLPCHEDATHTSAAPNSTA